jgi:hypothetical protein
MEEKKNLYISLPSESYCSNFIPFNRTIELEFKKFFTG